MKQYEMPFMGFVAHLHKRMTMEAFQSEGIKRAQPWILDYLKEHDGCIQRQLAEVAHFDPASITAALVGMEESGLIRREGVVGDKRALRVYLTELGREKQRMVQKIFSEADEVAMRDFTPEEKRLLHEMLHRIHHNLEREIEE